MWWYSPLLTNKMHFKIGKHQWQAWSKDALVFPVQQMYLVSACIWNKNASNTVHNSRLTSQVIIQARPIDCILGLSLHLPRPKCPSCIRWSVAWHFLWGITVQVPFKTIPSSTDSSSLKVQYGWISLGTLLMMLGHPCILVCLSSASPSSSWVAILMHSNCHF